MLAVSAASHFMWLFFERTLRGRALRATRHEPPRRAPPDGHLLVGARRLSFTLAAFIGALSGPIGPITTISSSDSASLSA